jgi:hypothetical protein
MSPRDRYELKVVDFFLIESLSRHLSARTAVEELTWNSTTLRLAMTICAEETKLFYFRA